MSGESKAVFLSYASQDAEAAKRICEALRSAGVEVWFDQSELVGGDQWDGKIRGQIGSCALFIPIISANTQARREGYFRLEWKLAAQRTHMMSERTAYLLPVIADATRDADADVPGEFRAVQWTRLPGGETPPAFCERVKKLLSGGTSEDIRLRQGYDGQGGQKTQVRTINPISSGKSKRRPWLVLAVVGLAAVAALAIWRPWRKGEAEIDSTGGPGAAGTRAGASVVPTSTAEQLAERAYQLTLKVTLTRDDLDAADTLVRRAAELENTSSRILGVRAWVQAAYLERPFDSSAKRRQDVQTFAKQALALNPDEPAALNALAQVMLSQGANAEAEALLRQAVRVDPENQRSPLLLARAVTGQGRKDEGRNILIETVRRRPRDLLTHYALAVHYAPPGNGNPTAAEVKSAMEELDVALSQQPFEAALLLKAILAASRQGDLATMRATLDQLGKLPLAERTSDRAIYVAMWGGLLERKLERVLAAAALTSRAYLEDSVTALPKDIFVATAYRMAGKNHLAQQHFAAAENAMREHMQETPGDPTDGMRLALILGSAGKIEEAARYIAPLESAWQEDMTPGRARLLARYYGAVGDAGKAAPYIERAANTHPVLTDYSLLLDPCWDPVRGQPAFEAIVAKAKQRIATAKGERAGEPAEKTPDGRGPVDSKSVAVLAFANLSDDKGNEYFSDGISEELLNVLAKIPNLKVSARTSAFYFKGKEVPVPEIARQLGVAYVVEGSVHKQGDKVRITAQLINAADGFHVWSDTFTRDLKDIFAVQDEIAGLIAQQLQLKLGESTRAAKVVNPEAYRLVLEGRQFWNLRSEEGFTKAEAAFTKALALDPQFAEAHAGLAGVCVIRSVYRELDAVALDANDLRRAVNEGRRALEIDPASAEAHAVLGYAQMMGNQLAEADRHFQQALELSPNSALVHCWYALVLGTQGRLDVSLLHYQKAAEVDPLWFINLQMFGGSLAFAQRFDQSLGIIERAAALRTEIFLPNSSERARDLLALGRKEEAFGAARDILRHPDDRPRWHSDAMALRVLWEGGRRQEAEDEAARLFARWPQESYLRGFTLVALGRFDEALAFLKYTPSSVVRNIYWDAMWDPWREDPRFTQLMAKLGRAEEYKVARATLARMQQEQAAK